MQDFRAALVGSVLALALPGSAFADDACALIASKLASIDLTKGTEVVNNQVGKTYKSLYDECDAHNTFNGKLLPKYHGVRLKCSTDPNRVAFIKKFGDGAVVFQSKMGVDADGSPASQGQFASIYDQPHTSLPYDGTPAEYVNAEDVSFVVIPQTKAGYQASFESDSGIRLGDVAVVVKNGRCSFGIVADEGPAYRIGEASMKAHEDLGNPQCKVAGQHPCLKIKAGGSGVGIGSGVTYILFPGTRPSPLNSATVAASAAATAASKAAAFFSQFQ